MRSFAFAALVAVGLCFACTLGSQPAQAQAEEQALVDRATLALPEVFDSSEDARAWLRRARAVMICPRVLRAGFIFAGQGGDCVLVGRDGAGSWSSPAFYTLGSASIGFQIGLQDAEVVMLIMNDRALDAILDSQFKIGAEAGIAFGTLGRGVAGATTAAVGADVIVIARARGLFAGISLDGTLLSVRSQSMRAYYGRDVSPRQVVVRMEVHNPASDALRGALLRLAHDPRLPPPREVITPAPAANARIQQENLPPPPRRR